MLHVVTTQWLSAGPTVLAAFLASLVEFVEALTIILAVGSVRGWRDAIGGAAAASAILLLLILVLGSALSQIPLHIVQIVVGALLLLFGLRWLRKAILRSAGVIPLHDEAEAFAKERQAIQKFGKVRGFDRVAFGASFQITMLEGTEVVFIVIAVGAGGTGFLVPAGIGALAAFVLVILLGVTIHKPLSAVPENTLKFIVGILLSAFGCFWFGEGLNISWPGSDLSILALLLGFLIASRVGVWLCRRQKRWVSATASN